MREYENGKYTVESCNIAVDYNNTEKVYFVDYNGKNVNSFSTLTQAIDFITGNKK